MTTNTPHKYAETIKAWADGAQIQGRHFNPNRWFDLPKANSGRDIEWSNYYGVRIKPAFEIPDGFTAWEGGQCPVDGKCFVEVKLRNGHENKMNADVFRWSHEGSDDIIAYKVIKQAPIVRWQWIQPKGSLRNPSMTTSFYTEDELKALFVNGDKMIKAEWTRMEFDE